jgi:hypothetical protein
MDFQDPAHGGFGNPDPVVALQVILNPQSSELIFRSDGHDFLNHLRSGFAGRMIGDGSFSIQARSSCFLVFLFPPVKAGTREVEFAAGFGDPQMLCKFKDDQLEPDPQFFLRFFVHTILLFVP